MGQQLKTKRQSKLFARSQEAMRVRDAVVKRLLNQLRELCPHITTADLPIARRFCEMEYLIAFAFAALKEREGDLFADSNKNTLDAYRRMSASQLQIANSLGLTPASRAMLRLNENESPDDLVAQFASDQKRIE